MTASARARLRLGPNDRQAVIPATNQDRFSYD